MMSSYERGKVRILLNMLDGCLKDQPDEDIETATRIIADTLDFKKCAKCGYHLDAQRLHVKNEEGEGVVCSSCFIESWEAEI